MKYFGKNMPTKLKELMENCHQKGNAWAKDAKKTVAKFDGIHPKKKTSRVEELQNDIEKHLSDLAEENAVLRVCV